MTSLRWGSFNKGIYYPRKRTAGFFSYCSTSLADLSQIEAVVQRIDGTDIFRAYKTLPRKNLWSRFFKQPKYSPHQLPASKENFGVLHHHSVYRESRLDDLRPFVDQFFKPSEVVRRRKVFFEWKYGLKSQDFIAVNLRGTDKNTEILTPPLDNFLSETEKLLEQTGKSRILVVADQIQYIEGFRERFGKMVITLPELPTTAGSQVIHDQIRFRHRETFAINFFATVLILADAPSLITHTGNTAYWTILFRGGTSSTVQMRGREIHRDN